MLRRRSVPPGDLIYLSERKALGVAVQLGLKTGSLAASLDLEGTGGVAAGIPAVAQASGSVTVRGRREDPAAQRRQFEELVAQIVRGLERSGLPDLEANEEGLREGGWFRFHRRLRFGVGTDDSTHSVRALVAVDQQPVEALLPIAGLLMNGSPAHVLPPYGSEELRNAPGSRSGSGTGRLFIWLDAVRRALDEDPGVDPAAVTVPAFESARPPRDAETAISMYRLFADDGWLQAPRFPQLLHGAPCEGVAQASFIAVDEEMTLVMASPLYIRVRALDRSDS